MMTVVMTETAVKTVSRIWKPAIAVVVHLLAKALVVPAHADHVEATGGCGDQLSVVACYNGAAGSRLGNPRQVGRPERAPEDGTAPQCGDLYAGVVLVVANLMMQRA